MEGIHSDDDEADDKDKLLDGKKKRSTKVGLFALEQKTSKSKNASEKRDDLLSLLTKKTVEVETKPEKSEEKEGLTSAEEKLIEQVIVQHRYEELDQDDLPAVKSFHEKILYDDIDSNQSLAETIEELSNLQENLPVELTEELITIDRFSETNSVDQDPELFIQIESVVDQPREFTDEPVSIKFVGYEAKVAGDIESEDTNIFAQLSKSIAAAPRTIASFIKPNANQVKDTVYEERRMMNDESEQKTTDRKSIAKVIDSLLAGRVGTFKSDKQQNQTKMNLETQVEAIERDIIAKESIIRHMIVERKLSKQPELPRALAPEASRLHSNVLPERIGRVLMTAEADKSNTEQITETVITQPIDRNTETISRVDLLELSGQAIVDGSSLRQAYETNLISEKALRRLVAEHLRGGDVRRALLNELVEHENDFERDPLFRDKSQTTSSSSNEITNKLTQQSENNRVEVILESLSIDKPTLFAKRNNSKQKRLSLLDIAMLAAIMVLLFMVIALVINRQ